MKPIQMGPMFLEELSRLFIREFKEQGYDERDEFVNAKYKTTKRRYLENEAWNEVLDQILDILVERYQMDLSKDEDRYTLEGLEELLLEEDIKRLTMNRIAKKLI